jgi:hypothetical protein
MTKWNDPGSEGRPNWSALALSAAIAVVLAGCGGDRPNLGASYPVKGKVTLPDGKAPAKLVVIFSGPVTGRVTTEGDGTFAFAGDNPGLPAGTYQVRLESAEPMGTPKKPVLPFPQRYLDEDASGLTATVTADGPNDFDFKLTKEDAPASGSGRRKA